VPEREEIYGTLRPTSRSLQQELQLRILQALNDNLPISLWAIDAQGVFVYHEGKGLEAAGLRPGQYVGHSLFDLYPKENTTATREALAGKSSHTTANTEGRHWEAWLLPVRNERGEVVYVTGVSLDVTEAKRAEQEVRSKLDLVEMQQQVIRMLSTPILQVWDGVLTLPVVGTLDSARAADVMDSVLNEVVRTRARYAILDVTGVEVMDTATASHMLRLTRALQLVGAEGIITGIRPGIAQTIVGLGVDLASIVTLATLREGLKYCIQQMSRATDKVPAGTESKGKLRG
jgi:rsbT co-antagonist protein RsbR